MATSRIDELRARLARDPGSRLFAQLAEELRKDGALVEAIGVCRDGLARHPQYVSARLTLGRCLLETRDALGAVGELKAAVADAPDNILAVRLLAEAQEAVGDLEAAKAGYDAALRLAPGDRQVLGKLEGLAQRAKLAGRPAQGAHPAPPAAPADPYAPIPLVEMDPLESFELETAGARPVGGPPADASATGAAEAAARRDDDEAPQTIRVKRSKARANYDDSAAAALEAAFAEEIERAAPRSGTTLPAAPAASAASPAPPTVEAPAAPAAELASVTLAELYRSQGAIQKAIDTCAEVLRREPDNLRARALVDELSAEQSTSTSAPPDRRAALETTIARLQGLLAALKRA